NDNRIAARVGPSPMPLSSWIAARVFIWVPKETCTTTKPIFHRTDLVLHAPHGPFLPDPLAYDHPIWHHPIWMDIRPNLDPSSETPLYRQLATFIQDLVRTGRLSPGDRLPPTRDLAGQLSLNRTTV